MSARHQLKPVDNDTTEGTAMQAGRIETRAGQVSYDGGPTSQFEYDGGPGAPNPNTSVGRLSKVTDEPG
jgi:hypothetical protein